MIGPDGEILRTLVGSQVHGLALDGSDTDELGVFVEPPEDVLGLHSTTAHEVLRSQPEGARSGPGDTDLVRYSLRKYLRLVAAGNPTILLPLFAPSSAVLRCTPLGAQLRQLGPTALSQQTVWRFLGYLDAQRRRMLGQERRGVPHRPELVARYGYDVKFASHALRLAYQGLEIVTSARLTLPMPAYERERVLAVKTGRVPDPADVLREIDEVRSRIETRLVSGATSLPAEADTAALRAWSVQAHRQHWGWS
jgi:predicted nucleotidyltransferase